MSPAQVYAKVKNHIKPQWKLAFFSALLIGLAIHLPIMLSDIPNHDGLDSMYFDQNMITSGRWFLTVACGLSSYFTLPWVIGLLGMISLALTAVALTEILELEHGWCIILCSGLLVSFPALTSTFAYVFTLDGYMLALLLAVLSVLLTKKYRMGFLAGALCLACSMGTYQAYLPFAIILCIYAILMICMEEGKVGDKVKKGLRYLYMGILGCGLYLVILQILLRMQGKELDTYQGINGLDSALGENGSGGILTTLARMYRDFLAFTLKGNVLWNNIYSMLAWVVLIVAVAAVFIMVCIHQKWWKHPLFFLMIIALVVVLPLVTNVILLISPDVTYHLLMRYQWVLYPILVLAFADKNSKGGTWSGIQWMVLCAAFVIVFNYGITDNIAYSNLEKRYEKTYAYCVRLLDRIEQTPGYYQGIPIAMIGVVGDEEFPLTDLTGKVTNGMIGMSGDSLLYTGNNYQSFMKNYLGATLNFLPAEAMEDIYYSEEYMEMDAFPGPDSTKVVDGILYVHTENVNREEEQSEGEAGN